MVPIRCDAPVADHCAKRCAWSRLVAGGYQTRQGGTQDFCRGVAEDRLRPRVPGDDVSRAVGGNDGVIRRFRDGTEAFFAGAQGGHCLLTLAHLLL